MSKSKYYKKVLKTKGIYKHKVSGNFYAEKRIKGKLYCETFYNLFEAQQWRKTFDGISYISLNEEDHSHHATLKDVWYSMQKEHFPSLATSTKNIWIRRYKLLESIEHLPMNIITPSKITSWVNYWVAHFKSDDYQNSGRGRAGRCNLKTELNLFVTIFNWYKESERYEKEALHLTCPIKRKHRRLGFIKPIPDKRKQIGLEDAFLFFEQLRPPYQDLATLQFYCASRIGETAGIQWGNIDFKHRKLLIKHTIVWDSHKKFLELKPFPKNREPRPVFITDEIMEILLRRRALQEKNCDYVFHVEARPINYGTILVNYAAAQRRSGVPYTGTHILRHGMAKLARKVGGGLDAVLAMTGHKDLKLADHYSKCDEDDQKEFSLKIMEHIKKVRAETQNHSSNFENVISLSSYKNGTNR